MQHFVVKELLTSSSSDEPFAIMRDMAAVDLVVLLVASVIEPRRFCKTHFGSEERSRSLPHDPTRDVSACSERIPFGMHVTL